MCWFLSRSTKQPHTWSGSLSFLNKTLLNPHLLLSSKISNFNLNSAYVPTSQVRRTFEYTKIKNMNAENCGVASFNNKSP
jgi:hypothetical protein